MMVGVIGLSATGQLIGSGKQRIPVVNKAEQTAAGQQRQDVLWKCTSDSIIVSNKVGLKATTQPHKHQKTASDNTKGHS